VTTGTVRELQSKLIESTSLIAILVDSTGNQVLGLVTLHDLLRAERAFGSDSE
jgi:CBS domain-containing protein